MKLRTLDLSIIVVLLLSTPCGSSAQRTYLARLLNRIYLWFSSVIGNERLCPAGTGLIDLATLVPCGDDLPPCPLNLACETVSTLCRNRLAQVTTSVCMPIRQRGQQCENDEHCSTGFCQPVTGTCEFTTCPNLGSLSVRFNGLCYFYQTADGVASYDQAEQFCRDLTADRGDLVSVNTVSEQEAVNWLLARARAVITTPRTGVYSGLMDERREGFFEWSDGSALLYTNWRGGTATSARNSAERDCVILDADDGEWEVTECDETRPSICVAAQNDFVVSFLSTAK